MAISDKRFLAAMTAGEVIVEPFRDEQLGTSSYDVCLGEYFYREQHPPLPGAVFNIYDPEHVARVWGELQTAPTLEELSLNEPMTNIDPHDRIIMLAPGETILAHTEEFIGGRVQFTSMMKARSSFGRSFITVCKCLHPDTLVRLANGTEAPISSLKIGDEVINVNKQGVARTAKIRATRKSTEAKQIVTVTTESGRSVTMSVDHLCRVSTTAGVEMVQAGDLRLDDSLPVVRRMPHVEPSHLTSDQAALLGYFVAEGNWSNYRLSFAKGSATAFGREQRAEIGILMNTVFALSSPPKSDDHQLMYNSEPLAASFKAMWPEICQLAEHKRLPTALLQAPLTVIEEFLRTYMACDSHFRKHVLEIELVSKSTGLIRDLVYLTNRLGSTPAKVQHRFSNRATEFPYAYAHYYGRDANNLGHPIPEKVSRTWCTNIHGLLRTIKAKYQLTRNQLAGFDTTSTKAISQDRLRAIQEEHNIEELEPYVNDIVWDRVVDIQTHNVLQNGFVDISLAVESEENSLFALADGLMVLNCAGWGDVGYISRWTFEITNVSQHYRIPLVVGEPIAQIIIDETGPIRGADYGTTGNYQNSTSLDELRANWHPSSMLPRTKRKRRQARG